MPNLIRLVSVIGGPVKLPWPCSVWLPSAAVWLWLQVAAVVAVPRILVPLSLIPAWWKEAVFVMKVLLNKAGFVTPIYNVAHKTVLPVFKMPTNAFAVKAITDRSVISALQGIFKTVSTAIKIYIARI